MRRYRIRPFTTLKPSWSGARVGEYGDVLEPVTNQLEPAQITAIHVGVETQPGLYQLITAVNDVLDIKVLDNKLPSQRVFPFYSEVYSEVCLKAYISRGLGESSDSKIQWTKQGRLTRHAIQLARSFGIEPVKQAQHWFHDPFEDEASVDKRMTNFYGYLNLVLKGSIAPPIIWCGSPPNAGFSYEPNHIFLKRINELAPPGTMAWCADEPSWNGIGSGMSVEEAVNRVRRVQLYAPRLIPLITTGVAVLSQLQSMTADLPIRYCIVQNEDNPDLLGRQKGSYFSCMAQGCGDYNDQKQRSAFPVAVLEGDPITDFQAAIKLAHANKALFALYYKINKCLMTCWLPGGLYNEGGNGDGTAMYVSPHTGLVIPSIRMMHWHLAQQTLEKQMLQSRGV